MRRIAALAACALALGLGPGCATPPASVTATPPAPGPAISVAPAAPLLPPPSRPAEAPPSGILSSLAITRGADAALTLDEGGGIRLWPTLDGTRPPIVIAIPAAREAILDRRATGFVLATRDDAGGLLIVQLDGDGRVTSRASVAPDPEVIGLVALDHALLAWRADQSIVLYGDDGVERARIGVDPGHRIVWIGALHGGGALAVMIQTGENGVEISRARVIEATDRTLAWGAARVPCRDVDGALAVSPNGAYLAHVPPKPSAKQPATITDLATGQLVRDASVTNPSRVEFASDTELVVQSAALLTWVDVSGGPPETTSYPHGSRNTQALVAGGGVAMTVTDKTIVINQHRTTHFLGYGAVLTQPAIADGHGGLFIGARAAYPDMRLFHIDHDLTATATQVSGQILAIARVTADRLLVESYEAKQTPPTKLELYAPSTGALTPSAAAVTARATLVVGEPTTGLVGIMDQAPTLQRYEAVANDFVQIGPPVGNNTRLFPVAPDLAGGTRLVRVTNGSPMHVEWLHDETAAATTEMTENGTQLADVDRAGHVLVWQKNDLLVLRDGKVVATIPDRVRRRAWPDPLGTRIAMRSQTGISMFGIDGALRWELALPDAQDVTWLDGRTLAIATPDSLARVSAATGAIDKLSCGLEFGLHDAPVTNVAVGESLCARPLP